MLTPPVMQRTLIILIALAAAGARLSALALFVQTPDDLWPEWQRLRAGHPLPAGTELIRLPPGAPAPGDRLVLGLGTGGKEVGFMPLVPVCRMWEDRATATRREVEAGSVRLLPLCSVALPEAALPVDGAYPYQPGYPFYKPLTLRLDSREARLRAWYDSLPEPPPPGAGRPGSIAWIEAVGDVMPARGVDQELLSPGGLERVFGDTLSLLRDADLLLGNLESSAARGGEPEDKSYTFRFQGAAVGKLREAGFSYLSLANNHTFDFGRRGFLQTLDALRSYGVMTSGAGANREDAARAAVTDVGGQEIRVLSFGDFPVDRTGFDGKVMEGAGPSRPGILWLDDRGLGVAARVFAGGKPGPFNIALVHGGREWSTAPTPEQKRLYRELVLHGADLVLGAHPHVLQGMEAMNGSLIVYSLGNFLFPGMGGTPGGQDSVILRLGIFDGKVRYRTIFPVRLQGATVSVDEAGPARREFLRRTRELALNPAQPAEGWQKIVREVF